MEIHGGAVGLQVGGIDQDALGLRPFAGKTGEDAVENTPAGSSG
jgi:hypothetical protein